MENNGEHLMDVNADGWLDVVSGSFMRPQLFWFENPEPSGIWNQQWEEHVLVDTNVLRNENTQMHDLDGDDLVAVKKIRNLRGTWIVHPVSTLRMILVFISLKILPHFQNQFQGRAGGFRMGVAGKGMDLLRGGRGIQD